MSFGGVDIRKVLAGETVYMKPIKYEVTRVPIRHYCDYYDCDECYEEE